MAIKGSEVILIIVLTMGSHLGRFYIFFAGLSVRNRDELDVASNKSFQKLLISTAWNLLENINLENKTFLECNEKDNVINYEAIEKFLSTGKV